MRPPSVELDLDQRGVASVRENAPVRARVARIRGSRSAPGFARRCHARAMDGIAANGELDGTSFFCQGSLHQREIGFLYCALLECFAKLRVSSIVLGDENHAGSFFVESVHDSGTQRIAAFGKFQTAPKQRVHQSARWISRTGMHGHSGGLVNGNHVFVFVEDFQRDGLGFGDHRGAGCDFDADFLAAARMQRSFPRRLAIKMHVARVNQFLDTRAAEFRTMLRDDHIEPPPCFVHLYGELMLSSRGKRARLDLCLFVICGRHYWRSPVSASLAYHLPESFRVRFWERKST